MKAGVITLYVFAVLVPLLVLAIGIPIILKKAQTNQVVTAAATLRTTSPSAQPNSTCGNEPRPCSSNTQCATCGEGWTCTDVSGEDTVYNVSGRYCLPARAETLCTQASEDPSVRIPGRLRWVGWMGSDVQQWECVCDTLGYPMDTSTGGCFRSSNLCRNGTWTYTDPDLPVWSGGTCECGPGKHVMNNASTGLPECVDDTCGVAVPCKDTPCTVGNCVNGLCVAPCETDEACGVGGACIRGLCTWGVWDNSSGTCQCPAGYRQAGQYCVRI